MLLPVNLSANQVSLWDNKPTTTTTTSGCLTRGSYGTQVGPLHLVKQVAKLSNKSISSVVAVQYRSEAGTSVSTGPADHPLTADK